MKTSRTTVAIASIAVLFAVGALSQGSMLNPQVSSLGFQSAFATGETGEGTVRIGFVTLNSGAEKYSTSKPYIGLGHFGLIGTSQVIVPAAGTLDDLFAQSSLAAGSGKTLIFTVYKNGAATALTCTITGTSAKTCNDLVSSGATVAAGDLLTVKVTGTSKAKPTAMSSISINQ